LDGCESAADGGGSDGCESAVDGGGSDGCESAKEKLCHTHFFGGYFFKFSLETVGVKYLHTLLCRLFIWMEIKIVERKYKRNINLK
jgi:hypothetical protein